MNTLLLYPEFPDTFWSYKYALKFIRKRAAFPPLGLLTVGAMLPKNWSKRLVDLNVTKLSETDLLWADCVFVSAMAVQKESARRAISICKKADLRVVAGGPLFTSEHEGFDEVDHFVLNEAELTLPLFLRDLERGCVARVYETCEHANIRETPPPMWELIDLNRYASILLQIFL